MTRGDGSLGTSKHRTSGVSGKSPKMRHAMKREAEANERKGRRSKVYLSITEVMKAEKPK